MNKLSIVIPVYNEVGYLPLLLARVITTPLHYPLEKELLIIDDYSTDGTRAFVEKLQDDPLSTLSDHIQKGPNDAFQIKCFFHTHNQGKGQAIRTGIRHTQGDLVVFQDADLEYDPADYNRLLRPFYENQADVVFGSRFKGEYTRVLYYKHTMGNKFLTFLSNLLTDINLTDMETCYKMFRGDIIRSFDLRSKRFGIEPEVTAKVAKAQLNIFEVPISYYGRTYAEGKKITWRDGIAALWAIVKYNWFIKKVFMDSETSNSNRRPAE